MRMISLASVLGCRLTGSSCTLILVPSSSCSLSRCRRPVGKRVQREMVEVSRLPPCDAARTPQSLLPAQAFPSSLVAWCVSVRWPLWQNDPERPDSTPGSSLSDHDLWHIAPPLADPPPESAQYASLLAPPDGAAGYNPPEADVLSRSRLWRAERAARDLHVNSRGPSRLAC